MKFSGPPKSRIKNERGELCFECLRIFRWEKRERERERWRGPATFGLSIEELIVDSLNSRFLPYSPKKAKNPFFWRNFDFEKEWNTRIADFIFHFGFFCSKLTYFCIKNNRLFVQFHLLVFRVRLNLIKLLSCFQISL